MLFNKTFTVPNLPSEINDEILVNNPSYMTLHKNTNKNLFYDKYCHQGIPIKEFVNYFNNHNISSCLIYTFNMDEQDLPEFTVHIVNSNNSVYRYILYVNNIDVDEYIVSAKIYPLEEFDDIQRYLEEYNFIEIYFDAMITNEILKTRSCQQINPNYASEETVRIIENHSKDITIDGLYSFFDALKKSVYLETNYNFIKNKDILTTLFGSLLEDYVFNNEAELISDNEEEMNDLIDSYNVKEKLLELFYF